MICINSIISTTLLIFILILKFTSSKCITDYTSPCPEGWTQSYHTSSVCVAPLSYHGPCSSEIISLNSKTDKVILESHCKVTWPCMELCERDLYKCPKGWLYLNDSCHPSSSYKGNCNYPISLSSMEMTQKILWSMKCEAHFLCKKSCDRDYSAKCPQGWKFVHGHCEAPPEYSGPCHTIADFSFFNQKMKEQFEVVCNVLYPCKSK